MPETFIQHVKNTRHMYTFQVVHILACTHVRTTCCIHVHACLCTRNILAFFYKSTKALNKQHQEHVHLRAASLKSFPKQEPTYPYLVSPPTHLLRTVGNPP